MADIDEAAAIVAVWPYAPGDKMLIAASDRRGFVVGKDEMISSTRKGRGVLVVDAPALACLATPAAGDHTSPRSARTASTGISADAGGGDGARQGRPPATLQGPGGLSDARVFALADGLTWRDSAGRTFTVAKAELREWIGNRAEAGRLPPKGFPKNNKFEG